MQAKKWMQEALHSIPERGRDKFQFGVNLHLVFVGIRKFKKTLNSKSIQIKAVTSCSTHKID